jgi:hypothetical protein
VYVAWQEACVGPQPCWVCPSGLQLLLLNTHVHAYFPSHLFLGEWWWVTAASAQLAAVSVALDTSQDLLMDCLSCSWGNAWGMEARVSPHPRWVCPPSCGFVRLLHLCRCPAANLTLVWTKGHDKVGVGIIQESHKKLWYKFSMGDQGPSKHREGKVDRDKQGGRTREGACE